jgi:hypothetical protein
MAEVQEASLPPNTTAISAAMAWAGLHGIPATVFRNAITAVTAEPVECVVVRWLGRARRIEERTAVSTTRTRSVEDPVSPSAYDPWNCDRPTLREETLRLVRCPECAGEKKVVCRTCGGRGSVHCDACGGSGRALGARGYSINCKRCRGQGETRCPCRDGLVTCPTCGGKGRCQHWLEVTAEPISREAAVGDVRLRQTRSTAVSRVTQEIEPSAVPESVGQLLASSPFNQHWSAGDRIDRIQIEQHLGFIHTLSYRLAGRDGTLEVLEWASSVEGAPRTDVVKRWSILRVAAGCVGLLLGVSLLLGHAIRGPFYSVSYQTAGLAALAIGLLFAGRRLFETLSVERLRRGKKRGRLAESAVVLLAAAITLLSRQPDLAHAERLIRAGQREAAVRELKALATDRENGPVAVSRLDRLLLDELRESPPSELWSALSAGRFRTDEGMRQAGELAEQKTVTAVQSQIEAQQFAGARSSFQELGPVPPNLLRQLGGIVDASEAASLWTVIRDRDSSIAVRLKACEEIQRVLRAPISVPGTESSVSERDVARACDAAQREETTRVERERREAERQARLARLAAEREERRREAAQRAWANAPLLCNDGTLSPSCVCGQSSRRGCCSWHGGVGGCSRDYP